MVTPYLEHQRLCPGTMIEEAPRIVALGEIVEHCDTCGRRWHLLPVIGYPRELSSTHSLIRSGVLSAPGDPS